MDRIRPLTGSTAVLVSSSPSTSSSSSSSSAGLTSSSSPLASSSSAPVSVSGAPRISASRTAVFMSFDDLPDLWTEPDVPPQLASATGYPLDVPPPHKLLPKVKKYAHPRSKKVSPNGASGHASESADSKFLNNATSKLSLKSFALPSGVITTQIPADPSSTISPFISTQDSTYANNFSPTTDDGSGSVRYSTASYIPFSSHIVDLTSSDNDATHAGTNGGHTLPKLGPAGLDLTPPPASVSPTPSIGYSNHGDLDHHQNSSTTTAPDGLLLDNTSSPPFSEAASPSASYPDIPPQPPSPKKAQQLIVKLKTNLTESLTNASFIRRSAKSDFSPRSKTAKGVLETANKEHRNLDTYFVKADHHQNEKENNNHQRLTNSSDFIHATASSPISALASGIHRGHDVEVMEGDGNPLTFLSSNKRPDDETQKGKRPNKKRKFASDSFERGTPDHSLLNTRTRHHEIDEAAANDDFCSTCHGVGRFLCCESCPKSFHFSCVDPPLDESMLPEGAWYCKECTAKQHPPRPYKRGLFSQLLYQLDKRNPIQFVLPKKIRSRFEGVSVNELGEYMDSDMKVFKSTRSGFVEEDPYRLTDKNGNPIFCYKCKNSSLSGGPIARCDYCSLNWHLDCLNPPLPTVKTIGTKWKCPNHADHVFKKRRRPKTAKIQDTALRRGFKNDGNIEVFDSSDEEQSETNAREVPLHDYFDTLEGVSAPVPQSILKPMEQNGVIYRIPAHGIKLDFIQAVHERNAEPYQDTRNSDILLALDELVTREPEVREGVRDLCYLQVKDSPDEATTDARKNLEILIDAALGNSDDLGDLAVRSELPSSMDTSRASPTASAASIRRITGSRRASLIANSKIQSSSEDGRPHSRRPPSSLKYETSNQASSSSSTSSISGEGTNRVSSRLRSANPVGTSNSADQTGFDYTVNMDNYISMDERTHLVAIQKLLKLRGKDALMDFLLPRADI